MTEPTSAPPPSNQNGGKIALAIAIVAILAVFGFVHIVQSSQGTLFIAKEHFSYSMTFTSVEEVLSRNNNSMHSDPLLEHLVQELESRGLIDSTADPANDPETERELARIWKQTEDQGVKLAPYAKDIVRKYYPDSP